jgi:hypothetical protein
VTLLRKKAKMAKLTLYREEVGEVQRDNESSRLNKS